MGIGSYSACRRISSAYNDAWRYLSVHAIGRAVDSMITTVGGDADNTAGDPIANFLVENAEYLGIQRVIRDGMYWNGEHGFSETPDTPDSSGTAPNHHLNHIHFEVSVEAAQQQTQFFTDGPPACSASCDGNMLVRADCSSVDCAATGEVCLDGLGTCGRPEAPAAWSPTSPSSAARRAATCARSPATPPGRT